VPNIAATLEGITPDVGSANYTVVFPDGSQRSQPVFNAWSLQTLISATGEAPANTAQVLVDRFSSGSVTLTPPDYTGSTDFLEGPAVVYEHETSPTPTFWFLRPIRLPAPQDVNATDWVQTPVGEDLTIHITAGHKLTVHVATSLSHPTAGQAVRFTAEASGQVDGEQLTYTWSFADGFTSHAGPAIAHAFARAGTYSGTLTVSGSDGSGGSAVVHVVVGSKKGPPGPGNGNPGGGSQSGGTGGTHGGTNGNGSATNGQGTSTKPQGQPRPTHPSPAPNPDGTQVQGYLVNAAGSAAQQAPAPSQASGPNGTDGLASLGWIRGAAAGAMAVGFFAVGAFLESDEPRQRLARRFARPKAGP
jgi:hypothetical protein